MNEGVRCRFKEPFCDIFYSIIRMEYLWWKSRYIKAYWVYVRLTIARATINVISAWATVRPICVLLDILFIFARVVM